MQAKSCISGPSSLAFQGGIDVRLNEGRLCRLRESEEEKARTTAQESSGGKQLTACI